MLEKLNKNEKRILAIAAGVGIFATAVVATVITYVVCDKLRIEQTNSLHQIAEEAGVLQTILKYQETAGLRQK